MEHYDRRSVICLFERVVQSVIEVAAIRQTGQRIMSGFVGDRADGHLRRGRIFDGHSGELAR